eukprot:c44692_g1_i1 orf=37-195(+)
MAAPHQAAAPYSTLKSESCFALELGGGHDQEDAHTKQRCDKCSPGKEALGAE